MIICHHVGIKTMEIEKSKKFYMNILDCELDHEYEDENVKLVFLKAGESTIELVHKKGIKVEPVIGVIEHLAFKVENIYDAIKMLKDKKIKLLLDNPKEIDGKIIMFFEGPNGEKFEFVEEKR